MFHFEQIESRKLELHRVAAAMDYSRNRIQTMEVLRVLSSWNWRLSAWQFFSVDRTMISGVNCRHCVFRKQLGNMISPISETHMKWINLF